MPTSLQKRGFLKSYIALLKHPKLESESENLTTTRKSKLWQLAQIWAFGLLLSILLGFVTQFILAKFGANGENAVVDLITNAPIWFTLLTGVIVAPILEEISFRSWLKFKKPEYFALGLGGLTNYLCSFFLSIFAPNFLENVIPENIHPLLVIFLLYILPIFGFGLIFYFLLKISAVGKFFVNLAEKHISGLFYSSSIIFGLIHSANFSTVSQFWYLIPVMVLPQLFLGFNLGYIRLKLGLAWSILLHMLHNGSIFLIPAALSFAGPDLFKKLSDPKNANTLAPDLSNFSTTEINILNFVGLYAMLLFVLVVLINVLSLVEYFKKSQ